MTDHSDLKEMTTEDVAQILFSDLPRDPNTIQIISDQIEMDISMIFEMMITIFMEGLKKITDDFQNDIIRNFTEDDLLKLNPWFYSTGFKLNVASWQKPTDEKFINRYCKIILKEGDYCDFLQISKIDKSYHFLLNGSFDGNHKKLSDIFALFETKNTIYEISFDYHIDDKAF